MTARQDYHAAQARILAERAARKTEKAAEAPQEPILAPKEAGEPQSTGEAA